MYYAWYIIKLTGTYYKVIVNIGIMFGVLLKYVRETSNPFLEFRL